MAKTFTKFLKTGGVGLLLLFMFGLWYKYQYSMDYVERQEIHNPAEYDTHLLIATQGSEFKDEILDNILKEMKVMECYIKVIDVSHLESIDQKDWDAICLIHTWEQWRAPSSVIKFIERSPNKNDLVVLTTSGSGDSRMPEIDGITSASDLSQVGAVSNQVVNRIKSIVRKTAILK